MKVLVTGLNGHLGLELAGILLERSHEVVALDWQRLGVAEAEVGERVVEEHVVRLTNRWYDVLSRRLRAVTTSVRTMLWVAGECD